MKNTDHFSDENCACEVCSGPKGKAWLERESRRLAKKNKQRTLRERAISRSIQSQEALNNVVESIKALDLARTRYEKERSKNEARQAMWSAQKIISEAAESLHLVIKNHRSKKTRRANSICESTMDDAVPEDSVETVVVEETVETLNSGDESYTEMTTTTTTTTTKTTTVSFEEENNEAGSYNRESSKNLNFSDNDSDVEIIETRAEFPIALDKKNEREVDEKTMSVESPNQQFNYRNENYGEIDSGCPGNSCKTTFDKTSEFSNIFDTAEKMSEESGKESDGIPNSPRFSIDDESEIDVEPKHDPKYHQCTFCHRDFYSYYAWTKHWRKHIKSSK